MFEANEVKAGSTYINVNLDNIFSEFKKFSKTNTRLSVALLGCGIYAAALCVRKKKQEEKIEKLTEKIKELTETKGE